MASKNCRLSKQHVWSIITWQMAEKTVQPKMKKEKWIRKTINHNVCRLCHTCFLCILFVTHSFLSQSHDIYDQGYDKAQGTWWNNANQNGNFRIISNVTCMYKNKSVLIFKLFTFCNDDRCAWQVHVWYRVQFCSFLVRRPGPCFYSSHVTGSNRGASAHRGPGAAIRWASKCSIPLVKELAGILPVAVPCCRWKQTGRTTSSVSVLAGVPCTLL